jgi:dihydrofolate synthase/folylpolyglutamate synthase
MTISYEEAVKGLYNLQKFGIKFGLSNTSNLLKALGNPQMGQRYIHIGGTNGKGSTAAFMASILREAGYRVGLYSSPHLVRFTERFKINGREISREKTVSLIHDLTGVFSEDEPPTFFEATTALAIAHFAIEKTDISIMEVGMGGRLDATNVISPLISIITNISMDHQFHLGNTLLDIAGEKAGIIKQGVDVVTGVTQPSVTRLFEKIAREKKAPFYRLGKDTRYRSSKTGLFYYGEHHLYKNLKLGLKGRFQARNAALALTAIERLTQKGIEVDPRAVYTGLKDADWPGRMQVVCEKPMIIVDGAHNSGAIRALAHAVKSGFEYGKLILVIGIMEDKDTGAIIRGIVPIANQVICTRPVYPRAAEPETLAVKAKWLNKSVKIIPRLKDALFQAKDTADPDDLILVTGSLFTAGEALATLKPEQYRPDTV